MIRRPFLALTAWAALSSQIAAAQEGAVSLRASDVAGYRETRIEITGDAAQALFGTLRDVYGLEVLRCESPAFDVVGTDGLNGWTCTLAASGYRCGQTLLSNYPTMVRGFPATCATPFVRVGG